MEWLAGEIYDVRLQWGRVLMNAETSGRRLSLDTGGRASMGPRSHERGNSLSPSIRIRR